MKAGLEAIVTRPGLLLPRTIESRVAYEVESHFEPHWLDAESTPLLAMTAGHEISGLRFRTNYEKFIAHWVAMLERSGGLAMHVTRDYLTGAAAANHCKSVEDLQKISQAVGSGRILVAHGAKDRMVCLHHGADLARDLKAGKYYVSPNSGHCILWDNEEWMVEKLAAHIVDCMSM